MFLIDSGSFNVIELLATPSFLSPSPLHSKKFGDCIVLQHLTRVGVLKRPLIVEILKNIEPSLECEFHPKVATVGNCRCEMCRLNGNVLKKHGVVMLRLLHTEKLKQIYYHCDYS